MRQYKGARASRIAVRGTRPIQKFLAAAGLANAFCDFVSEHIAKPAPTPAADPLIGPAPQSEAEYAAWAGRIHAKLKALK